MLGRLTARGINEHGYVGYNCLNCGVMWVNTFVRLIEPHIVKPSTFCHIGNYI